MSTPVAPASSNLGGLLRTPTTVVWLALIAATALSWLLGTNHGVPADRQDLTSVVILLVAFAKVRFIGLWFMELRAAPLVLRGLLELYCVAVCAMTVTLFLVF